MENGAAIWTAAGARSAFKAAPGVRLTDVAADGSLVVVAPHPDDETLGCGGLIAEAAAAGRRVIVALLTDGAASHPASPHFDAEERGVLRAGELRGALAALSDGEIEVAAFGASDGELAGRGAEAARWLQGVVEEAGAATLFVTWEADHHPDHKAAFAAASQTAAATGVALWAYPVWSLILPDDAEVGAPRRVVTLDIGRHETRKREAIASYASQLDVAVMGDPGGFLLRPEDVERHVDGREVFLAICERP